MHLVGLEPTSLSALEPESSVCANFTTGAQLEDSISNNPILAQGGIIKKFKMPVESHYRESLNTEATSKPEQAEHHRASEDQRQRNRLAPEIMFMKDEGSHEESNNDGEAAQQRADRDESLRIRERAKVKPIRERKRNADERNGFAPDERRAGCGTKRSANGPYRDIEDEVEELKQQLYRLFRRRHDLKNVLVE